MNNLSWFLYSIGVIGNIAVVLGLLMVVLSLGSIIYTINYGIEKERLTPHWWKILSFLVVLGCILSFIPSRETMLMIAASQVGEQVIQLEEVKNIGGEVGGLASDTIELLRQNIQQQLTESLVEAD